MNARFPALFVSHGAPTIALEDNAFTRALAAFGSSRPRPKGVVVVSGHWESGGPVRVNAVPHPEMIYDFAGFPDELYQVPYPAPGSPDLAAATLRFLADARIDAFGELSRGWDHGLWVPLRILYPDASIPVVEVSLPVPRTPQTVFEMGRALAPLRDSGVLLLGTGGIVHNLRRLRWTDVEGPPEDWAQEFDAWVAARLEGGAFRDILEYRTEAPSSALAVPTSDHFDPIFFALGAALPADRLTTVYAGFTYGTLSMRTFALEAA